MAVTAALINKQSVEKEQRVKILDLKSNLYLELIDLLQAIIIKGEIAKDDMVKLEYF